MQKQAKKLALHRETLKHLSSASLSGVAAGSGAVCYNHTGIIISQDTDCHFPVNTVYC
jgi:hypothetical protein